MCDYVWLMHEGGVHLDLPAAEAFQDLTPYQHLGVQVPKTEEPSAHVPLSNPSDVSPKGTDETTPQTSLLSIRELQFSYPNTDVDAVRSISCEVLTWRSACDHGSKRFWQDDLDSSHRGVYCVRRQGRL